MPFHHSCRGWGIRHASRALLLLAIAGCSKKETSSGGQRDDAPTVTPILEAGFGKSDGQLGSNVPEEGLPEGPKSFVVDASGALSVLDQENARVQRFALGKLAGSVTIPARAFDDIELWGNSGYALLDVHAPAAIVFVNASGQVERELVLESEEIPEPSQVTALTRHSDGYYVEVSDDYLVRVADASGAAVPASVVPGQALDGSSALKADLGDPAHVELFRVTLPSGDPKSLAEVAFGERVARRTLLAGRKGGGALLGVVTESEQADPETPPHESSVLVVLDPSGHEKHRVALPLADGPLDVFRSVKRGDDGNVYVLVAGESGVKVTKVTP